MIEITTKRLTLFLIPFLLIAVIVVRCWGIILFSEYFATWRHYIGLFLFTALIILSTKNRKAAIVSLGIFLLLGICNLFAITPTIETTQLFFLGITTPPFNPLCLGLFVLYLILNGGTLIELELDYREKVAARQNMQRSKMGIDK